MYVNSAWSFPTNETIEIKRIKCCMVRLEIKFNGRPVRCHIQPIVWPHGVPVTRTLIRHRQFNLFLSLPLHELFCA